MAYRVELDPDLKRRYRSAIGWRWLWFVLGAWVFFAPHPAGWSRFAFWFGIASLAIGFASLVFAGWKVLVRYQCPACGRGLREPLRRHLRDPQIRFDCPDCEIRWDTGLHW